MEGKAGSTLCCCMRVPRYPADRVLLVGWARKEFREERVLPGDPRCREDPQRNRFLLTARYSSPKRR